MTKSVRNSINSLFILLDFLLTFIGIHIYGIITEGNPYMVWIFEIPFIIGFLVVTFIVIATFLVSEKIVLSNKYNWVINFFSGRNLLILILHMNWIRLCY